MIRLLGRWGRRKPMRKVDLANHDHCGSTICRSTFISNEYDNTMDIGLAALQSFHIHPNGVYNNTKVIKKKK